jgi:hypothetical protein
MQDLTLFDTYTVPHNRTAPSIDAGRRLVKTSKTREDEARLLEWIASRPQGATDQEIYAHFGWEQNYARPRRWTLHKDSKIKAAGYRVVGRKKFTYYVSSL